MKHKLKSYAKLNLFLHILDKNSDNYHLLESFFSFVDLYDDIEIKPNHYRDIVAFTGEMQPEIFQKDNIITAALDLFHSRYRIKKRDYFNIAIDKNIPVGAGLGGGSSNAASILKFLDKYYDLSLADEELIDMAGELGADVPFFINKKSRFIYGIGEEFGKAISLDKLPVILLNPGISLTTKDVFALELPKFSKSQQDQIAANINKDNLLEFIKSQHNDLTESAIKLCPQIKMILDALKKLPAQNSPACPAPAPPVSPCSPQMKPETTPLTN